MALSRTRLLALCTVGVVAVGAGGFVIGRRVKSPADAAAAVAAPPASRLAVPIERRVLSATIITRGDVRFGDPKPVVLPPSTLKANRGNLVTLAASKGDEIVAGKRIFEVAGRPVIAMVGSTPAYRDLRPDDTGDDVKQLESGLTSLGLNPGPVDGTYDAATQRAVDALYRGLGYESFGPTDSQRTQQQQLRDTQSRASDSVRSAQRAYDTAAKPAASRTLQAGEQVRTAQEKAATSPLDAKSAATKASGLVAARQASLDQARTAQAQAVAAVRKAERERDDPSAITDAQRSVDDASAALDDANLSIAQAQRAVPEAQRSIDDAVAAADDAQRAYDTAKTNESRGTVVTCPLNSAVPCEVPDATPLKDATKAAENRLRQANNAVESARVAFATRQEGVVQAQRARDRASRSLARATDALAKARDAGPDRAQAVDDAQARVAQANATVAQAERDLADALDGVASTDRQSASASRSASSGVAIAQASQRELVSPSELASLRDALASANDTLRRATTDFNDFNAKVGISVPADEIVFLPDLPRRVDDVKVGRGEPATGAVITVTNARLAVDASVDAVDAPRLRVGSKGEIEAEDLSLTLPVTVTKVANRPGTDGAEADRVHVELTIDSATGTASGGGFDPSTLNGVNVKVTLPITSTQQAVLAVPVAAVSIAGDGTSRVEIEDDPAKPTRFVTVNPGLSAEGYVEVEPVGGARLNEGDLVVVGSSGSTDLSATTDDSSSDTSGDSTSDTSGETAAGTDQGAGSSDESSGDTAAADTTGP